MAEGRVLRAGATAEMLADPEAAPLLGLREAGAMLTARVVAHTADGLTELAAAGGQIFLPRITAEAGAMVRLRIHAQDIMLALDRPEAVSALNILKARVTRLHAGDGPGVMVGLDAGGEALLARVTRRSADALDLRPGLDLFAVLKSVAPAQDEISWLP
jgi:molybdate transport system ATP-binding protein